MTIVTCPPPTDLERLFLGGVPSAAVDCLEQHVLHCDACLQQLKGLLGTRETLAGLLRDDTGTDAFGQGTVVDALIGQLESLRPTTPHSPNPVAPMIAFTCSGCPRKLSVKADLAGKKIRCPGCGQVTVVPVAVAVMGELRTLPPGASAASALPARDATVDADRPTVPPASKPDVTQDNEADDAVDQPSLTDFLAPPQADDELGRLGKYRILKILGHGGMGVVFKAEDPKLKRSVAIKAMLPTLAASASAGKRFLREAQAMAAVEHDHIVRIYQVDEERGVPFLAMEFLKGEPLDERLKREANVPVGEVLRIGREIAEALEAAHATGLIHRDVKPANVWLEAPRGRVKILDFGLARAATQESGLTQQGAIIGTPAYMAPEQARGEAVDHRCDLFSLGVVLYRLCTGQLPFQGRDTVSTLMEVALHAPAPPILANLEIPQALSDLVMQLLEKDPAKRLPTAGAVVEALQAIEAAPGAGTVNAPKPAPAAKPSRPRKNRRPVALIAVALATLFGALTCVAGGIVFFWPTADGTVRIEINDPDIQVAFDKKALVFKGAEKQELRVSPGAHGLHVQRGDLEFDTDKLVLKKGQTITLKVEWLKNGKLQLVQDGKVIGNAEVAGAPLDDAWLKRVAALSAEKQVQAVADKLKERNPSFDGKIMDHKIEGGVVTELQFYTDNVTDISPVQALAGLRTLGCYGTPGKGRLADLSPLKDMKLTKLYCPNTQVSDLAPLHAMPLTWLYCDNTKVSDLAPLRGMPLTNLRCDFKAERDAEILRSIKTLEQINGKPAAEFWKEATAAPPLDPAWLKKVANLLPEAQGEAVKAQLMERNPGFDGKMTFDVKDGVVTGLTFAADKVTDLSPVRALTELRGLLCPGSAAGKGRLADLSPLKGLSLVMLHCYYTRVSDLAPLKGMPLKELDLGGTNVTDLSPLKGMPLEFLSINETNVSDLSPLKGMKLRHISCSVAPVSDLSPLKGMKLLSLNCGGSKVTDLSPLDGMPLTNLQIWNTQVSDLAPLRGMPLTGLHCGGTKVTDLAPLRGMPLKILHCDFKAERDAEILRSIKTLEQINGKPAGLDPGIPARPDP